MATGAAGWIPYAEALCKDTANIKAGAIVGIDGEKQNNKKQTQKKRKKKQQINK